MKHLARQACSYTEEIHIEGALLAPLGPASYLDLIWIPILKVYGPICKIPCPHLSEQIHGYGLFHI